MIHRHLPFIFGGLAFALTAGFGFGVWLGVTQLNGGLRGNQYIVIAHAHGTALLFGWMTLTLLGLGLGIFKIEDGTPAAVKRRVTFSFWLLVVGIAIQVVLGPLAAFVGPGLILRWGIVLAGILELCGLLIVVPVLRDLRRPSPADASPPAGPLAQVAVIALVLAFVFNLLGVWNMAAQAKVVMPARYSFPEYNLMVFGVGIPLGIFFTVRAFNLSRTAAVQVVGLWKRLAVYLAVGLTLRVAPYVLAVVDDGLILTGRVLRANYLYVLMFDALAILGTVLLAVVILIGLVRSYQVWRRESVGVPGTPGYEYLVLCSAFAWLAGALVLELVRVLPILNERIAVPEDAARHAMLMGYAALMLIGLTIRLVPDRRGATRMYSSSTTWLLLLLGNLAALLRVVPLMLSTGSWSEWAVGLSGVLGWTALLLLFFELILMQRNDGRNKNI